MATIHPRMLLTYEDYLDLPDDGKRYEILEGELAVTPAPNVSHQWTLFKLGLILGSHVEEHELGTVLCAPCDVLLSEISVVQPDLLFVARERESIVEHQYVKGPPDLVVEILSPGTAHRDQGAKRQLYAQHGVPYYWLIEPVNRELLVFQLDAGDYRQVAAARGNETLVAPPFPNLTIPLARLWRQ